MAKNDDHLAHRMLGDIRPNPGTKDRVGESAPPEEDAKAMHGGSKHDRTEHPGSRDVTEGTSGGLGTETGGTRNFRTGTGATGGDIGNRPE
jgi:hypothetical protein